MNGKNKVIVRMRRKSRRGTVISANYYRRRAFNAKYYRKFKWITNYKLQMHVKEEKI